MQVNNKSFLRSFLFIAMLALVLVAAGCASNTNQETPANSEEPAPTEEAQQEATEDAEYTVTHAMGETTIKGTPQRVVILTNEGTEALLELGVTPVGAVNSGVGDTWYPHILDKMSGVAELGDERQPNMELIASLEPDLIIGNKVRQEEIYTQLSNIAPTVFSEDLAGQWKENFTLYAEALNKQEEGKQALERYQQHVDHAKSELGDKLSTKVSVVRFLPTNVRIYLKDTFSGTVLSDLGFARPESQDIDEFIAVITKEQMADMDGDIMFFFNADYDEEKGGTKMQEEWMNDPLYQNLQVAKNKKAFQVDEVIWNLSGGIISATKLVDELLSYAKEM
ncbi:ABC transporter substrate-binding protein [Caldalkalibacillus mannanilyticus]|uniref:ABC transporter substrate-binding protein n=1 Tax=Caldalkalibacillus mannanilyticus TaxID=1418 RepID=UPI000468C12D|nr:iron-siderophore ABC transporter substrate-binding protein [Caldalkalibacillus mannanilyticus]